MMKKERIIPKIAPVMLAFFTMGFVDLVGIATNYVKSDFGLSDTAANSYLTVVFLWFLIFSVPTGILMNKIGRRKTVIISLTITFVGLLIPFILYNNISILVSFSFLGIGNTLMQVSLNPLLTNIVSNKRLPSYLTSGQFIKAIASLVAPIIAGQALIRFGDWKLLFPVFAVITFIAIIYLYLIDIKEHEIEGTPSTFKQCFGLLGNTFILLLFFGILVHVGIDVGVNVTIPKLLEERMGMPLSNAGYATSIYFLFRTFGCLSGTFLLAKFPIKTLFTASVITILLGILGLFFSYSTMPFYVCVGLIGIGNSNIFPIILSSALMYLPARNNEISGLMIMGISGGAIFPVLMGFVSDSIGGQVGAVLVLTICVGYLLYLTTKIKTVNP